MTNVKLGVNIDHIATLRQVRGTDYPSPLTAALIAIENGADSITVHLREDRRHIQESDVRALKAHLPKTARLNLEMAVTEEMLAFAEKIRPDNCCLVPEKREELTTEGGLDVAGKLDTIRSACQRLGHHGMIVSLFIEASIEQIDAAKACGAPAIELHTGHYANLFHDSTSTDKELERLKKAAIYAHQLGLVVNAGHGLTTKNVAHIMRIPHLNELNIGHSIIADAVMDGMSQSVKTMRASTANMIKEHF